MPVPAHLWLLTAYSARVCCQHVMSQTDFQTIGTCTTKQKEIAGDWVDFGIGDWWNMHQVCVFPVCSEQKCDQNTTGSN